MPPELLAANAIFTYQKNLVEFARVLQHGKPIRMEALYASIDMLRLNLTVFEALAEERRG